MSSDYIIGQSHTRIKKRLMKDATAPCLHGMYLCIEEDERAGGKQANGKRLALLETTWFFITMLNFISGHVRVRIKEALLTEQG